MPAKATEDTQPDISEQSEALPSQQPQYRGDVMKSKNPRTEPRARRDKVWIKLGDPPAWHECNVFDIRDNPEEKGKKQYQLTSTEPKKPKVGDGQWYAQELLWDLDEDPAESDQMEK